MKKTFGVSSQTRNNWLIDSALFLGAVVASITGIYFLFFPVGGYQGGRNPSYGITILFQRETWDDLHTWFGIVMIVAAAVHIVVHWKWIVSMSRRVFQEMVRRERRLNGHSRYNVGINVLTGLSFLVAAISGVVLLFAPGGRESSSMMVLFFSRTTWDLIHTWAGVVMILVTTLHFVIHWGWVTKVSRKVIGSALSYLTDREDSQALEKALV